MSAMMPLQITPQAEQLHRRPQLLDVLWAAGLRSGGSGGAAGHWDLPPGRQPHGDSSLCCSQHTHNSSSKCRAQLESSVTHVPSRHPARADPSTATMTSMQAPAATASHLSTVFRGRISLTALRAIAGFDVGVAGLLSAALAELSCFHIYLAWRRIR